MRPSYGRKIITFSLEICSALLHVTVMTLCVYAAKLLKVFSYFCYCCWHLERKPFSSKYRWMQLSEDIMCVMLLYGSVVNKMWSTEGNLAKNNFFFTEYLQPGVSGNVLWKERERKGKTGKEALFLKSLYKGIY